jgi:DNA polymerase
VVLEPTPRADAYRTLVAERKACAACEGCLANPSRIDGGIHDSDRLGPYSRWQGNLDAPLVVVGQDFADVASFRKYGGWPGPDVGTNLNLVALLREAGFEIQPPRRGVPDDRLFFTNAVLCMKAGAGRGRQQRVPAWCFKKCSGFLRRTIEIVSPRVVVTLGTGALAAVRRAFEVKGSRLRGCVGKEEPLREGTVLVPMYHPSPTVVNTTRSMETMRGDWCDSVALQAAASASRTSRETVRGH